ncbi:signal peptidase I [Novosphingobium album (ex Liu et al. 2023)]|uniref:Signal peptidase I n=1 Tax=Novosphingobium album (ex Liu et al. 2023) TaxID=3031130 RepID=A0ABT5WX06_9SPHN|nr:signal peptidase I [Novosphingobium album (ex Liu et al. 2023)]MDE8654381.1 signal peptidase I [Novosphingobium album (ex Liu et al. 2023)]
MTETAPAPAKEPPADHAEPEEKQENFLVFLLKLVVIVLVFRSFIFSPFNIPSESMLPRLENGDYLLASKWSYGFSKYSLPFSVPLIPGRILASQPTRGDIAIFKAPPGNDVDYIKRVIGLPGDRIQVRGGQLFINGKAVPKRRIGDFLLPVSANTRCYAIQFEATLPDGSSVCRYPQFRETLPGGKSYNVLDLGQTPQDDTEVYAVPQGHLFLMGDNRDNSLDSRFPAVEGQGIGIVPQENLVGKASVMMFSTDGGSEWLKPWTWFTSARWSRIGGTF